MRTQAGAFLFLVVLVVSSAQALVTTGTLPEGINSPSFRFGVVDKIGERYTAGGNLMSLGDIKSLVFDQATLKKMNGDAKKLIDALNSFGNQGLGDKFNFGVLRIHTEPQVKYFAPVYARGLTSKWTLGVGLPVVTYSNKISISQDYSNLEYYRQQLKGLSKELDDALNINLTKATNDTLAEKGYKPLDSRNETFLGDIQVASVYKFFENADQALVYQAMLSLPTGPQYNSDDLAAINIFGRTSLANTVAYSHKLTSRLTLLPYATYQVNFQDRITARVPTDEEDSLPDQNSKELVDRQLGNTRILAGNAFYELNDQWTLGAGYEHLAKNGDHYSGGRGRRYDLLSQNTDLSAQRVKGEVTYSSVKSYFKKTAVLPMMLSLEVSDVVAGYNVERQQLQEMNLMLFF